MRDGGAGTRRVAFAVRTALATSACPDIHTALRDTCHFHTGCDAAVALACRAGIGAALPVVAMPGTRPAAAGNAASPGRYGFRS